MKIAEILLKYKTDKNYGTIKNIYDDLYRWNVVDNPEHCIGHSYGLSYDEIFEKFDRNDPINFLEIGVQKGGSMVAWKDYFQNGNIYGIDIIDVILPEYRRNDFNYIIKDIRDLSIKETLKDVMFDIIIDDGSHHLDDVIFVVNNYLDKLNKGGFLIIEDCQQPEHWVSHIKALVPSEYEFTTRDLRHDTEYSSYDNFLIVIERKA
jgi:SAM-dependent methyltransferase